MPACKKLFDDFRKLGAISNGIVTATCPVKKSHGSSLRIYSLHPDGVGIECVKGCAMDAIIAMSGFPAVPLARCVDLRNEPHIRTLRYHFVMTSDLASISPGPVEWFRPDVFPKGASVSMSGISKDGKSTFIFSELAKVNRSVNFYYVSEEAPQTLYLKAQRFGLGDNFHILSRPPMLRWDTWPMFAESLQAKPVGSIFILDTTQRLSRNPDCLNPEYAVQMIIPFEPLTERGDLVVHVEHSPRKGGRARGSSAQDGAVDWLVNLSRMKMRNQDKSKNRGYKRSRRRITCEGRLANDASNFLVELIGNEYRRVDEHDDQLDNVDDIAKLAKDTGKPTTKASKETIPAPAPRATSMQRVVDLVGDEEVDAKSIACRMGRSVQYVKRTLTEAEAKGLLTSPGKHPVMFRRAIAPAPLPMKVSA